MVYDLTMLEAFYSAYKGKVEHVRAVLKRPLTLAEKILYAHLFNEGDVKNYKRGEDYVNFRPDRVAMQDATAQMALLQFMNAGKEKVAVPSTVHCDHLIQAYKGAKEDIATATKTNEEVYDFLRDVSSRYGIGFWKPGAGIIHQVVLENYAFPGGMMVALVIEMVLLTVAVIELVQYIQLYVRFLNGDLEAGEQVVTETMVNASFSNGFVSSKVWDNLERFNHVCKEEYGIELF